MLPSKGLQVIALFLTLFPEIVPAQEQLTPPCSLEQLAHMSWPELEALYRQSCPGAIPHGYAHGRPLYCPDKKLSSARTAAARMLWHGKHFCPGDGSLVNQWTGFKAVRARVFYGPSWLDGKPSIIADYCGESRLIWADVRDELREVAPGLYLGIMYRRRCCGPKFDSFFALQLCP
jgi:hypothetical protein